MSDSDTYYYVSIVYYGHKVFKCHGMCPDEAHKEVYLPLFEQYGNSLPWHQCGDAPTERYKVVLMSYVADRITQNENGDWIPWTGV